MSSGRAAKKCRAVVVTKDGKRYLTAWRATMLGSISAAKRLAERKKLEVERIDGMILTKVNEKDITIEVPAVPQLV